MKRISIVLLILSLVACNQEASNKVESKADETKTAETSKKPEAIKKTENQAEEHDDHAGHDHGKESNSNGLPYTELATPFATENNEKVVVYEFFGYKCGHCFNFEPQMTQWAENKPDYVEIIRVPLNFQQGWGVLQQAYLTASSMGIAKENHAKLFAAIHKQRKNFRTIEELAAWYASNSKVTEAQFLSTAQSFIIDSQQRKADKMGFAMKITGTPSLVVNGKYKPSNNQKSHKDIFNVVSELAEKEAKTMGLLKP